MCLPIILCAFPHIRTCYTILVYIFRTSLSFHRDTIYLFYIYIYFAYHCCSRRENTSGDLSPYLFFFLPVERKSDKVIHMYIDGTSYLLVTMHLLLEAPCRKITNKRKRELFIYAWQDAGTFG